MGANARKVALTRLGQRLRSARVRAGKTQSVVADFLETSTQTVRNWEAGRNEPPGEAVEQLARLYSVPTLELLYENYPGVTPLAPPSGYPKVGINPLRMADARRLSKLTQEAVARLAGVNATSISRYERGMANPTIDTLDILSVIYAVPVDLLMYGDPHTDEEWTRLKQSMGEPAAFAASDAFYRANAETVLDAYYRAKADLSPEAETTIARFINFIHDRELRRLTGYWTRE